MAVYWVTGQRADTPTRGLPTRGCHRGLCVLSFRFLGGICESATCPVRESSSPRVGSPRVGVSASCPVTVITTSTLLLLNPSTSARFPKSISSSSSRQPAADTGWSRLTLRTTFRQEQEPSLESAVYPARVQLLGTVFHLNNVISLTLTHS